MKVYLIIPIIVFALFACSDTPKEGKIVRSSLEGDDSRPAYALVLHGGAGTILKKNMSEEKEKEIRATLNEALTIGEDVLKGGGSCTDAVVETIKYLENNPNFNAGKGAVFTNKGENELDASIMEGKTQNAGAVGGVKTVKNPITAALAVMNDSPHVLLTGEGADQFAKEQGLEIVGPDYFKTERRLKSLERAKKTGSMLVHPDCKYGTVGVAALDQEGNIAAGTSTGGMTNKKYQRLGDSPIIGAGTYANNATCALSCTGHGEYFIRFAVAHDVSARMEYLKESIEEAANYVINEKLKEKGGSGGLIGLDSKGNVVMPFNTPGMYRGFVKPGERFVGIYGEEG